MSRNWFEDYGLARSNHAEVHKGQEQAEADSQQLTATGFWRRKQRGSQGERDPC